jgi:hypothetical protein
MIYGIEDDLRHESFVVQTIFYFQLPTSNFQLPASRTPSVGGNMNRRSPKAFLRRSSEKTRREDEVLTTKKIGVI